MTTWESGRQLGAIPAGTKHQKGEPIFPRLDAELEVAYIAEAMTGGKKAAQEEPSASAAATSGDSGAEPVELKEEIGIEDFARSSCAWRRSSPPSRSRKRTSC